jgi:hypothetical protein
MILEIEDGLLEGVKGSFYRGHHASCGSMNPWQRSISSLDTDRPSITVEILKGGGGFMTKEKLTPLAHWSADLVMGSADPTWHPLALIFGRLSKSVD